MSLIRLCRVGGDCNPSSVASLRCFSTMMPSISSSRAMSVRSGVMGIDSVARRTLVDILKIKIEQVAFRSQLHILFILFFVTIPLHFLLSQIFAHFSWKVIEPMEGTGMEKSISRLPENCRHLVVVIGHQLWFGRLLGKREEAMDILDSLKCFLKDKHIGRNITLIISQIICNSQFNFFLYSQRLLLKTCYLINTCHSSMLIALSSWTRRVSRCIDWLSGLLRLMAVLWLWCRWIWPKCIRKLSQSLRNSALRVYWRQNLNAVGKDDRCFVFNCK